MEQTIDGVWCLAIKWRNDPNDRLHVTDELYATFPSFEDACKVIRKHLNYNSISLYYVQFDNPERF